MTGLPPERRLAKLLGVFSFGLGISQLAAPERVNKLIGVKDTPTTRAIQRAAGVQELCAGQGIFAFSPPTPILWSRVAGDAWHLGMLANALRSSRNGRRRRKQQYDDRRLLRTMAAAAGILVVDAIVSARYQSRWPKEPTGSQPLPATRDGQHVDAHFEGHPAITIRADEAAIRPRLREFELDGSANVVFRGAPGGRGTEVVVQTRKHSDRVKAKLRQLKQVLEVGEIVRSEAAPEGAEPVRQIRQRPAKPLKDKELEKVGGRS
jgi:hypothetical protein